jgi:cytidyltransferase-like protein
MIFEKLVNHFLSVLGERSQINDELNAETIAMIPGSFKPPHKGHYAMIEHFSNISDRTIVIISDPQSEKSVRRTPGGKKVTSQEARQILEIYTRGLSNVELVTSTAPVKWVYDFVAEDTTPGQRVLLGVSGKGDDANRYLGAQKYAPEGVTVEASVFSDSNLDISASTIRQVLDTPTLGKINQFLPTHLSKQDKEQVIQILSQLEESEESSDWILSAD